MTEALLLGRECGWPDGWVIPILMQAGLLTPADGERIEGADADSAWQACLVAGIASDEGILAEVARYFRMPPADLRGVAASAAAFLPGAIAVRWRVVPLGLTDRVLDVACDHPANFEMEDAVAFAAGRRIRVHLASPAAIESALSRLYPSQFVSASVDRLVGGAPKRPAA